MSIGFLGGQALASVAVLLTASVVCSALRRSTAAHRHLVWFLAFAGLVMIPVASWFTGSLIPPKRKVANTPAVIVSVATQVPSRPVAAQPAYVPAFPWSSLAFVLWGAGTAVFAARACAGVLACERRRRRGTRAVKVTAEAESLSTNLGLRKAPAVLVSDDVGVPETFGWRAPVVVLPMAALEWPADRLRLVLLHELFHIRRRDWAVHLLARLSAALFWFNPLARYGLARLSEERERACDDDVLRSGIARVDYAHELVSIAGACRAANGFALAIGRGAPLESRVRAILDPHINRGGLTMTSRIFTVVSAALVFTAASLVTAPAQTGNAKVGGVVTDPSGARVPGAEVTISKGTAVETTRARADGAFEFSGIPDGTYSLSVASAGFKRLVIPDVAANASTPAFLNLMLEVGSIMERLTITAQGQPRERPPAPSTALERAAPATPRTATFATVVGEAWPAPTGRTRIRVGGNVHPAKAITIPAPAYPPNLVADGVEGMVVLDAVIGVDGRVLSVTPKNSQVHPELIQAAVNAVKEWRYEPTLLNGQPVEVATTISCDFRLKPYTATAR